MRRAPVTLVAVVCCLLASGAAGCGGDGDGYPDSERQAFMRTCETELTTAEDRTAACECVLDEVERTIPYEQYKRAATAIREGTELDRSTAIQLRDAVQGCLAANG